MTSANNNKGEDNMKNFTKDEVAKGYVEMGAINLAISHADFVYENEAMAIIEGETDGGNMEKFK